MLKQRHYQFEAPKIIGIISDKAVPALIQKRLNNHIRRRGISYVCLPFKVEPNYLKNVIACMRLMDIIGLIVVGKHTKLIGRFLPRLDRRARKRGIVNVVLRRKNRFIGSFIETKRGSYNTAIDLLTSSL